MKHLKHIKRIMITGLVILTGLILMSCGKQEDAPVVQDGTMVCYLEADGMGITFVDYDLPEGDAETVKNDLLNKLKEVPAGSTLQTLMPEDVTVLQTGIEDGILKVDFSGQYYNMSTSREVLARCGYVRTLMQVPDVRAVTFFVDGEGLTNAEGKVIGRMTNDSFAENSGKSVNTFIRSDIVLYFADSEGRWLVPEGRAIYYNNNKSLEWAIVERLIAGPKTPTSIRTIPADTRIISVSVQENCCYVNLSQEFTRSYSGSVSPEAAVYSIVDSILRNCNLERVQISVEGAHTILYGDSLDLSQSFEKNNDIVME
ncbi:MAG: GerMN domain-containing protein [Lachnospiraceae bacterium]|nr:GerMN domain-containing protein [Candidatus Equihabitans merdae]